MDKKELRQIIRQRKRQLSEAQRQELSVAVNGLLLNNHHIADAKVVMLYSPLPDEVDVSMLTERLRDMGKTVVLPVVTGEETMAARLYEGRSALVSGAYGINEPTSETNVDSSVIEAAIIPGMAFDRKGHRLGRGKGYYDRFLADTPYIYKIGVCFPFQIVDDVPCDIHDVVMDEVITP